MAATLCLSFDQDSDLFVNKLRLSLVCKQVNKRINIIDETELGNGRVRNSYVQISMYETYVHIILVVQMNSTESQTDQVCPLRLRLPSQ